MGWLLAQSLYLFQFNTFADELTFKLHFRDNGSNQLDKVPTQCRVICFVNYRYNDDHDLMEVGEVQNSLLAQHLFDCKGCFTNHIDIA